MKLSYYTVDDLRLGYDPKGITGWRLSQFLSLKDALAHYMSLPAAGEKVLGLTDGVHCLEITKCVPLFQYDKEGEDILVSDYKQYPLWAAEEAAKNATQTCITALRLRYMLCANAIVPIPKSDTLPPPFSRQISLPACKSSTGLRYRVGLSCRYRMDYSKRMETPRP